MVSVQSVKNSYGKTRMIRENNYIFTIIVWNIYYAILICMAYFEHNIQIENTFFYIDVINLAELVWILCEWNYN